MLKPSVLWMIICVMALPMLSSPPAAAAEAPDQPGLQKLLTAIKNYAPGQSRKPLVAVEKQVNRAGLSGSEKKAMAVMLAAMLKGDASLACKKFLCRQLSLIGTDQEIGALVKLLADKKLSLEARFALERIPGEKALAALRKALPESHDKTLVGIINTLGVRRDAGAVDLIKEKLAGRDREVVGAALTALGKIGDKAAAEALAAADKTIRAALMPVRSDALLTCARRMASAGDIKTAVSLYQKALKDSRQDHIQMGALLGLLAHDKENAALLVASELSKGDGKNMVVLHWLSTADSKSVAAALKESFPSLTPDLQVTIIQLCMDRKDMGEEKALHVVMARAVRKIMALEGRSDLKQRILGILLKIHSVPNLALGAKATSPDGWEKDGASGGDQAAIDGDPGTYWDEADGKDRYRLCITLKAPASATAMVITGYQHHQYAPKTFTILCDGKPIKTVKDAVYTSNELVIVFDKVTGKAFELDITGYYGNSPAIRELKLFDAGFIKDHHK